MVHQNLPDSILGYLNGDDHGIIMIGIRSLEVLVSKSDGGHRPHLPLYQMN